MAFATSALPRSVDAALPPATPLPVLAQSLLFGMFRPQMMRLMQRRYGDMFTLHIAPRNRRLVVLTQPEHIKTVFSGAPAVYHAGEGNAILGPIMGEHSVLLVDEDKHVRVRRLLMPAFHGARAARVRAARDEVARDQARRWPVGRAFGSHAGCTR